MHHTTIRSTSSFASTPILKNLFESPLDNSERVERLDADDTCKFTKFGFGKSVHPRFDTITKALAHQVRSQPSQTAVECGGRKITYAELDAASNRLANLLIEKGVRRGDAVGLYLHRSIEMVIGIFAVLKIGAAYVPQHIGVAPEKALRHIAGVTRSKIVLTLASLQQDVPLYDGQQLVIIEDAVNDGALNPDLMVSLPHLPRTSDTAIILFTSGTTGVPNGVQVTHQNLCNILLTAPGDLGIESGSRVSQILSIAFDMAAWETLGCLTNGGTLVIRGRNFQEVAESVDVLIATPSILGTIDADRCRQMKTVAVAGEPCPRPLADEWSTFCNFYNSCGPTETTIINTAALHHPGKKDLTIGGPTPNNTVYILDENLQPLPIGEKGEMWAGGDCVTAGYFGNDKLNEERYRPDPFLGRGRMMFRTRDLGRWTENGELEHCGRVDDQVKVRGFRVELDGVSSTLESVRGCEKAVTLRYDSRNLVSFVSPANVDVEALRVHAKRELNYYCVPVHIIAVDEMPMTPRGKLDKALLLEMAKSEIETAGVELG